ncbi:MAG: pyridoxamine 5'-phosphate oxidase family protein [Candidatus Omnitrophota bacterium]|jgi:predicted pyridoxine 5'-phosphate oxidase superfamily flavin-nucleotide-binding protein|nr:pyridoxamine 5'-phosphate oxidase family protein [Candidatus Omnitrophota bacterium]MDD3982713.1 pyridoxamine 5'-phosphate oxidase family protein [Candidatus Omnitrophota bacterium]MDD5525950.1 pyridoxamine 5'-phosphate oxidase family protein [Candidatus Omnitrophota bacterium]
MIIPEEVSSFLLAQSFVVACSIDADGYPHASCKGVVDIIAPAGEIYLLDLYKKRTYGNILRNGRFSVTAVEEHGFKGYCLKGEAEIILKERLPAEVLRLWEKRITARLAQRLITNLGGRKGHPFHPEALLPAPEYMIKLNVASIMDLTPAVLKT